LFSVCHPLDISRFVATLIPETSESGPSGPLAHISKKVLEAMFTKPSRINCDAPPAIILVGAVIRTKAPLLHAHPRDPSWRSVALSTMAMFKETLCTNGMPLSESILTTVVMTMKESQRLAFYHSKTFGGRAS
jgi:hypothetical protein